MKKLLYILLALAALGASACHIVTQGKERELNLKYLDARRAYTLHGDHDKAFPLLTELVELEYPLAFYELGVMYEKGEGTTADLNKATALYKQGHPYLLKTADKNDDSALSYLREMYLYGRGVTVDRDRAKGYFQRIKHELRSEYVKQKLAETEG